ncbi:MAG: hypothetical protein M1825_002535 [Sarcosagium campestre]|nr:MAG: hypothetical protein M1825_002535 [Sarcosagium campestre]
MELSRRDYPAMLDSLEPAQAVTILNDRVKVISKVNQDIADWLQERRKVEESYALGLKRLSRKPLPDGNSDLGIFSTPWQKLVSSTETIATSHQTLATRIELDVERPLKEFMTKSREMQGLSTTTGNFASMAKDIDVAQDKADKLTKKGAKAPANKVASATSEVEHARSQWTSQAPFVFESLQAVDESRLNHLRDVLTQFQTHEVDQVERNRVSAESCLNTLLNVETADEIKTFVAKSLMKSSPPTTRQRSRTNPSTSASLSPPGPPPVPSRSTDDGASEVSRLSGGAAKSEAEPRVERLRALKRLGTVIGRRKGNTPGRGVSPEKRSAFGRSSRDAPPVPAPRSSAPLRSPSPMRAERLPSSDSSRPPILPQLGSTEQINGDSPTLGPTSMGPTPNGLNGTNLDDITPAADRYQTSAASPPTDQIKTQTDAEGFTLPPTAQDPISQAEQEAAGDNGQPQFKLDIRNAPIREEDGDAATAMSNVANALRAQAAPGRKTGTVRGRRDVRNTIFVPSGQSPEVPHGDSPSVPPFKPSRTNTLASEDHNTSDAQSVRSSRSLSSLASTTVRHPEMHQPGLNASLAETVTAEFEQGRVKKVIAIGEVALVHNSAESSASPTANIRLDNFHVLEKVAPNPAFIDALPNRTGEYSVALGSIARTTVAFKYQVHLDDSSISEAAPLTLTPTWKIEPTQASVILSYALNPAFLRGDRSGISLTNVSILIRVQGGKASACQSKPVGTFSKERSLIYWQLGELVLDKNTPAAKLLARFTTESEAQPGIAEARWEIVGEQATGLGSGLDVRQTGSGLASPAVGGDADPFADEDPATSASSAWKQVPSVRRLLSGKYTAV